jgi:hypothetical protein
MNLNNHIFLSARIPAFALILVSSVCAQTLGPNENQVALQGSRLTYYQRPAFAQCQSDCANNPNCKGFTWIAAGTYNPSDRAMCYLMSAVTGRSSARGHFSGVKQLSGSGNGGTTPGGATITGSWQWRACNDEYGLLIGITATDGTNFTGGFENGNGTIKNGTLRGNRIEFDRDGGGWQQHYSGQVVNDRGQLKIINGVWSGAYVDRCAGRANWHAEKR